MNNFLLPFQAAVIAFVYTEVLIKPGHLFYRPFAWISRKLTKKIETPLPDNTPEEVKQLPGYEYKPVIKISEKRHWSLKMIGDCPYCTTGQLTLWAMVTKYFVYPYLSNSFQAALSTLWLFIFSISLAILIQLTIKKIYDRLSTT